MKTFITDHYQVTLMDNGGFKVLTALYTTNIRIMYNPDENKPWSVHVIGLYTKEANNIADLELEKSILKILRKALEVVNKQDIFDKEIVFLNKDNKDKKEKKTKWI